MLVSTIAVNAQNSTRQNSNAQSASGAASTVQQANDSSIKLADPTIFLIKELTTYMEQLKVTPVRAF